MDPIGSVRPSSPLPPPRDLSVLGEQERAFVDEAVNDAKFGAKNAFILNRYFAYPVHKDVDPSAYVPAAPNTGPGGLSTSKLPGRGFEDIFADSLTSRPLHLPGMAVPIEISGATDAEMRILSEAVDAIPEWSRAFLSTVRQIRIVDLEAFRAEDGSVSERTSGVADTDTGRIMLNRRILNETGQWPNCLLHELGHFEDRFLQTGDTLPSRAQDSPLGNHGVWYTNYAWLTQDQGEDFAEGYAILAQRRHERMHPKT